MNRSNLTQAETASPVLTSEEELGALLRSAPSFIVTVDRDGRVLFINRTVTDSPKEEVVGKNCFDDFLHPEFHDIARKTIQQAFETGQTGRYEARAEIAGRDYWFETHVGPVERNGQIVAAMLIASDITERKRAEQRLRLLSTAFEQSTEGIAVSDLKGNLIELNNAFAAMHGYTREEVIGKNLSIVHTPEQMLSVAAANRQLRETGEFNGEIWHVRRDGSVFPTAMHNSLLRDEQGKPVGMVGTMRDITERKQAEEALGASEARLRTAMESLPFDFFVIGEDGRYVMQNSHCKNRWGDLLGKRPEDVAPNRDALALWESNNRKAFSGQIVEGEVRFEVGGQTRTYHNIISPIFDDDRVRGILGVNIDITDRRRAEDLLRLQRDLSVAATTTSDLTTALNQFLDAALHVDGIDCGGIYVVEEASGQVVLVVHRGLSAEFVGAVCRYNCQTTEAALVALGKPFYRTRAEFRTANEPLLKSEDLRCIGVIPVHHEERVVASLNVGSRILDEVPRSARDALEAIAAQIGGVIARARAEQALRRSEQHYRALIENASDLIAILGEDGTFRYFSPAFTRELGYDAEELKGKNAFDFVHPDDAPWLYETFQRGNQIPGHVEQVEFRFKHKSGSWRVMDTTGTNLLHVPAVKGAVINARDITERRAAEEASLVFSRSLEQSSDAIVITGADRSITFANQVAERLSGYALSQMKGRRPIDVFGFDPAKVNEAWAKLERDHQWSGLLEGRDRLGVPVSVQATIMLICDEQDKPIASVGVLRDTRESRRLESIQQMAEAAAGAETTDDEAVQRIMAHLPELVGVDRWGIYLYKPESDSLELAFYSKTSEALARAFPTIPVAGTIHGQVLRTGQIECSPDIVSDDRFVKSAVFRKLKQAASSFRIRGTCLLPLRAGDKILGTLNVSDQRVRLFTPEELSILKTLASQISRLLSPLAPDRPQQTSQGQGWPVQSVSVVAQSDAMKIVLRSAQRIAATNMPAVILGPTGAGKGHVARYMHSISPRADGPFLTVNCACLDGELILSELFGHERGAFTGAVRQQKGCFEIANGGTLLLDEVVELPRSAQAKLLQLVETQQFRRLGGEQIITTDVRIICTTNADIRECVRTGKIRQDLYYRLSAGEIAIPPLCERPEDIQPLAEAYLRTQAMVTGEPIRHITPGAVSRLREYHWPGNVRELQNVLALGMSHGGRVIGAADLRFAPAVAERLGRLGDVTGTDERELILRALRRNRWNRTEAAEELGIHRNTLRNRMRKYNIVE